MHHSSASGIPPLPSKYISPSYWYYHPSAGLIICSLVARQWEYNFEIQSSPYTLKLKCGSHGFSRWCTRIHTCWLLVVWFKWPFLRPFICNVFDFSLIDNHSSGYLGLVVQLCVRAYWALLVQKRYYQNLMAQLNSTAFNTFKCV